GAEGKDFCETGNDAVRARHARSLRKKRADYCRGSGPRCTHVPSQKYPREVTSCRDIIPTQARHHLLFINSSTALVMPMIPTLIVGSGTGANLLECSVGNSFPSFLNCAIFSGSTAPM